MSGMKTHEYWIIFKHGDHWINHFLKKNFSHMYIMTRDEFNWIQLDPLKWGFDIKVLPIDPKDDIGRAIYNVHGHRVIKLRTLIDQQRTHNLQLIHILSCVSMVKYVTGIKVKGYTPYRIFKRLCKMKRSGQYKAGITNIDYIL